MKLRTPFANMSIVFVLSADYCTPIDSNYSV